MLPFATRCHTNIPHHHKKNLLAAHSQIKIISSFSILSLFLWYIFSYWHARHSQIFSTISLLVHFAKSWGGQSAGVGVGGCQHCKVPCCYNDCPANYVWTKRAIRTLLAPTRAPAVVCFCQIEQRKQAAGGAQRGCCQANHFSTFDSLGEYTQHNCHIFDSG